MTRRATTAERPRIHRIELPLPLQLARINIYLIEGPGGLALVDTGMYTPAARAALVEQLAALGARPDRIGQVFITHFHLDHFGQADWLQGTLGAELLMPRVDSEGLQRWFFEPDYDGRALDFFAGYGVPRAALERSRAGLASMRAAAPVFGADRQVEDGEVIELAGVPFEVLVTPGHTPGHACLHHAPTRTLLLGDHVLAQITPNVALSRGSLPDPLGAYRASLARVRGRGYACGLPAHGAAFETSAALDARIDAIVEHHAQREAQLLGLLDAPARPCSAYTLSEALFELDALDGWETWMAVGETLAHLQTLVGAGKAVQVRCGDVTLFALA